MWLTLNSSNTNSYLSNLPICLLHAKKIHYYTYLQIVQQTAVQSCLRTYPTPWGESVLKPGLTARPWEPRTCAPLFSVSPGEVMLGTVPAQGKALVLSGPLPSLELSIFRFAYFHLEGLGRS